MNKIAFVSLLVFSPFANASTAFASQFSHFAGGFLGTLLVAFVFFYFLRRFRDKAILWAVMLGSAVLSTVYAFLDQAIQYMNRGGFWGQAFDFASHTLGTILAVYVLIKVMKYMAKDKADVAAAETQESRPE